MRKIILYTSLSLMIFSCSEKEEVKKPITSCFKIGNVVILAESVVNFKNCSEESDRYEWNFGDGRYSTIRNPTHVYEKTGVYDIVLSTYNDYDEMRESLQKVTINRLIFYNLKIKTKTKNGHIIVGVLNGSDIKNQEIVGMENGNRSDFEIQYYMAHNNILKDRIRINYMEYLTPGCDSLLISDTILIYPIDFMNSELENTYLYQDDDGYEVLLNYDIL